MSEKDEKENPPSDGPKKQEGNDSDQPKKAPPSSGVKRQRKYREFAQEPDNSRVDLSGDDD